MEWLGKVAQYTVYKNINFHYQFELGPWNLPQDYKNTNPKFLW